ncbi:MAG: membrane dipeptidase [Planctomycetota bacterium]
MRLILDAHLDLSLNALEWNRDLRRSVHQIRESESQLPARLKGHAHGTVAFPDMRDAGIGICVATQIGGCMKPRSFVANWESPAQAWAMTQGQLAWYREMQREGELAPIRNQRELKDHLARIHRVGVADAGIGFVLSLEGADSIVTLDHLERAWEEGLRALGPSHYGVGRYAMGHDVDGDLPAQGEQLIRKMNELGLILDLTHLNERCFWRSLELFDGPVWASHHMCRAIVDDPRQLNDAQIRAVAERGGVVGAAFDVWMVVPGYVRGQSSPASIAITLENIADHIDHVCQLLGNTRHSGIGSDLDGGFGTEQCPTDMDTIADLQKLEQLLARRGYTDQDLDAIFHGNFLRVLHAGLPD